MLREYAIIPDVLDPASYDSEALADVYLAHLKEVLLQEALVRDLRAGDWGKFIFGKADTWHLRGKELCTKLRAQSRLRLAVAREDGPPNTYRDWCHEAVASHGRDPLSGIIAANAIARDFSDQPLVASIERLNNAGWWQSRSCSARIARQTSAFLGALRLILCHANSLMFIDPHLDPTMPRYASFIDILLAARRSAVQPRIEVHRRRYEIRRGATWPDDITEWDRTFGRAWGQQLRNAGMSVEVFIWPSDFHDRFLVTNLVGLSVSNGFDASNAQGATVTLARLSRKDRDDVQREFDPATNRLGNPRRFCVG